MSEVSSQRAFLRMRGRSFMALVLIAEPPGDDFLVTLDDQRRRAPTFFEARPVIVDVSAMGDDVAALDALIAGLQARDVRIIGVEGAPPSWEGGDIWGRTPLMAAARADRTLDVPEDDGSQGEKLDEEAPDSPQTTTLFVDRAIRSGQVVLHLQGDVVIFGGVASGAEIMAGGSVHVYGALRGRAIAGMAGHSGARIVATRMDPELVSIDGVYKLADTFDPGLRNRGAQVRLENDTIILASLHERGE